MVHWLFLWVLVFECYSLGCEDTKSLKSARGSLTICSIDLCLSFLLIMFIWCSLAGRACAGESKPKIGAEEFCFLHVSYSHCTICPRQLVYSFPVLFWVVNRFTQREGKKGENKGYAQRDGGWEGGEGVTPIGARSQAIYSCYRGALKPPACFHVCSSLSAQLPPKIIKRKWGYYCTVVDFICDCQNWQTDIRPHHCQLSKRSSTNSSSRQPAIDQHPTCTRLTRAPSPPSLLWTASVSHTDLHT